MFYFELIDGELIRHDVEVFPQEMEEMYAEVRQKFTIDYWRADSADDDSDAGRGYCYSNTYHILREPLRQDMVMEGGKLAGFYIGYAAGIHLVPDQYTKKYFLELLNGADKVEDYNHSRYYNNFRSWKLIIEEIPAPKDYVFLNHVTETDPEKQFVPEDFDGELIASVEKQQKWEDSRGDFNEGFYVTLKLTETGIADPDRVLEVLKEYNPEIIRV